MNIRKIISLMTLSLAAVSKLAFASQLVPGPAPANTGFSTIGNPACAASANGTGHLICVFFDRSNSNLFAFSLQTQNGGFPASPFDPAKGNPLSLGVRGSVGISSCASTADASGDVVCAYTAFGTQGLLMGIRFNIFTGKVYPVMNLGLLNGDSAACTNASERFTVTGPPAQEGPNGATVCLVGGTIVAFNPASGFRSSVTSNVVTGMSSDPTCANANDGTEQVICVYNNFGSLRSVAFNTNPLKFVSAELNISPSTVIGLFDPVSCSSPNDRSGDVLCAAGDTANNELLGFAVNPRTGHQSAIQNVVPGTEFGTGGSIFYVSSCAGVGDKSSDVICSFVAQLSSVTQPQHLGVKFDPRTGFISNVLTGPTAVGGSASCTFQNVNAAQISCGAQIQGLAIQGLIFNP